MDAQFKLVVVDLLTDWLFLQRPLQLLLWRMLARLGTFPLCNLHNWRQRLSMQLSHLLAHERGKVVLVDDDKWISRARDYWWSIRDHRLAAQVVICLEQVYVRLRSHSVLTLAQVDRCFHFVVSDQR